MKKYRTWGKATAIRTIKTIAESMLALIGTNNLGITEVNWWQVLSVSALAGVCCILTCIAGLPEVE